MRRFLSDDLMQRLERWSPLLLLLGTAALYLSQIGAAGLYDPNEGMYAEIPREMLLLRDWVTPHFNFVRYFEKPPLLYWLTAIAYQLFGVSQFSARLVTGLAGVAGVGIVYGIGRDVWGKRAGLLSGLILATTFGYYTFSQIVLTDMLFTALLAACCWALVRGLLDEAPRPACMLAAYASMALAVLTKGLIGIVFPVLTVAAFLLLTRDWRLLHRLEPLRGGALFLAIALPWHLLVGLRNPGFFWFYFVNNHFQRFLGERMMDYAPLPFYTYLAMVLVWMFPWSIFLPVTLRRFWPRLQGTTREERGFLFVLLWAAAVIGFFACSSSRLEYYSMPAFPALALCVGRMWGAEVSARASRAPTGGLSYSWFGLFTIAVGLVPASLLFPRLKNISFYNMFPAIDAYSRDIQYGIVSQAKVYPVPSFDQLVPLLRGVALIFFVGIGLATCAWLFRRRRLTIACMVATMVPSLAIVHQGIVLFEPHRSILSLAEVIRHEFRPGDLLLIDGPYENFASADFYTGEQARVLGGHFGDLAFGSRYPEAKHLFLTEDKFVRLWQGSERVFLLSDAPDRFEALKALTPGSVILGRSGKNWLFSNRATAANSP